jgi:hypothetical protein
MSNMPCQSLRWKRRVAGAFGGVWGCIMVACTPEPPPGQGVEEDPAPLPLSELEAEPRPALRVRLIASPPPPDFRFGLETEGLALILLERGLADLSDVVPQVGETPAAPGLDAAIERGIAEWRLSVALQGTDTAFTLGLELCPQPSGPCESWSGAGIAREDLPRLTAEALRTLRITLGKPAIPAASARWERALSLDPYATLICGRGAASLYGLLPPPEHPGDRDRDPAARAVYIDPANVLAQWVFARRMLSLDQPNAALEALVQAREADPQGVALAVAEAAILTRTGRFEVAVESWRAADLDEPGSTRFARAQAKALLGAGQAPAAARRLDALPETWLADPEVASLRVAIADADVDGATDYDALLARWQAGDPQNPEPVRRRVALRVKAGRYADALAFQPDYAARGASSEGETMALALHAALGQWEQAAVIADSRGDSALSERLRAAERLARDPASAAPAADPHPRAGLARGHVALAQGRRAEAEAIARDLLRVAPYDPPAWRLLAQAGGRPEDALMARAMDPSGAHEPHVPAENVP